MPDTMYDAAYGFPFSFIFTPEEGPSFGTTHAQVEEANTPPATIETAKYTPISGENAGIEQFALGRFPVQEYKMKITYSAASHSAALACMNGKKKGVLVCTYGDGSTETYRNAAVTSVAAGPVNATGLRTAEITITCPVPADFSE